MEGSKSTPLTTRLGIFLKKVNPPGISTECFIITLPGNLVRVETRGGGGFGTKSRFLLFFRDFFFLRVGFFLIGHM